MRYCDWKTAEIIQTICAMGKIPTFDDIVYGSKYLDTCCAGKVTPNNTLIMISIDDAQLYHNKELDCWFGICIILNLSSDQCYKKQFVLPAFFVPNLNKSDNVESFLLSTFWHISALQQEGLTVYNGCWKCLLDSCPFFAFGTANTVTLPILNGMVGHHSNNGCR